MLPAPLLPQSQSPVHPGQDAQRWPHGADTLTRALLPGSRIPRRSLVRQVSAGSRKTKPATGAPCPWEPWSAREMARPSCFFSARPRLAAAGAIPSCVLSSVSSKMAPGTPSAFLRNEYSEPAHCDQLTLKKVEPRAAIEFLRDCPWFIKIEEVALRVAHICNLSDSGGAGGRISNSKPASGT